MAGKPEGRGCMGEFARKVSVFPASNRIHVHLIGYSHASLAHKPLAIGIPVGSDFKRRVRTRSGVSLECAHEQFMAAHLKHQRGMWMRSTVQLCPSSLPPPKNITRCRVR